MKVATSLADADVSHSAVVSIGNFDGLHLGHREILKTVVRRARELGLGIMVGNMVGTSLAMAPSFLVGQLCNVVDLDGPVFLSRDRASPVRYEQGMITCPEQLWGAPESAR